MRGEERRQRVEALRQPGPPRLMFSEFVEFSNIYTRVHRSELNIYGEKIEFYKI